MEPRHRPQYAHVAVGRAPVKRVPVVQTERDTVGFGGRFSPFEDFFRPIHSKVRRDFSSSDEFVLARVPQVVVRFAVFELRLRISWHAGVGSMRGEARERPSGSSFERVVRFFLMEAEVFGELAANEVFF